MRSVYFSYTLLQNKKNVTAVKCCSSLDICGDFWVKIREIRKNNLLPAVTRRRLHRFMYISENIYRLDIFILCVFFRSRIKISVNNKLYMKQICHMSPRETALESCGECWRLVESDSSSVFRQNKEMR